MKISIRNKEDLMIKAWRIAFSDMEELERRLNSYNEWAYIISVSLLDELPRGRAFVVLKERDV